VDDGRDAGCSFLPDAARELVRQGVTTPAEMARVLDAEGPREAGKGALR